MTIGFLFWLFMILWLVFGFWNVYNTSPAPGPVAWLAHGGSFLIFILFLLLGIQAFGWPIRG